MDAGPARAGVEDVQIGAEVGVLDAARHEAGDEHCRPHLEATERIRSLIRILDESVRGKIEPAGRAAGDEAISEANEAPRWQAVLLPCGALLVARTSTDQLAQRFRARLDDSDRRAGE